tara:strand:- start:239 stop:715 length:477 start_codon:yes stop_codon:yes gene_type:complete
MSKFKKMYRDFFSLKEQAVKFTDADAENAKEVAAAVSDMADNLEKINANNDPLLDEAQLVNNLTDYAGHVIYQLRDPQEATAVAKEIQRWTTKKGFTIIKHEKSKSGRTGYFYFRVGEDPGSESQKIQGYFAQLPELSKFAFKAPRSNDPRKRPSRKF